MAAQLQWDCSQRMVRPQAAADCRGKTRASARQSGRHPLVHSCQCQLTTGHPALQIVEAVTPVRDNLDAILVFPSMPAVMRLNKLGSFAMSQLGQGKSVISDFMKKQVSSLCSHPH